MTGRRGELCKEKAVSGKGGWKQQLQSDRSRKKRLDMTAPDRTKGNGLTDAFKTGKEIEHEIYRRLHLKYG